MRLLVHTLDFDPEGRRHDPRGAELLAWLAGRGHALCVVSASPHDDEGRALQGYSRWRWRTEVCAGAVVTRCPARLAPYSRGFGRLVQDLTFAMTSAPVLLRRAREFRPDVVAALAPSPAAAAVALAAARRARVPSWAHLAEYPGARLGIETAFARVSVAAADAPARLLGAGVAAERQLPLPPWVDTRAVFPPQAPSPLRAELDLPEDAFVVLVTGELSEPGADLVIDAARRVPQAGAILFVAAGAGPAVPRFLAAARELKRLAVLPWPPQRPLDALLGMADLHLMATGLEAADPLIPGKLGLLLASGRAVVACRPAARDLVQALGDAQVTTAEDGAALAAQIVTLAAQPAECWRRGRAARRAAQDYFEKERVLRRLERGLEELVARPARKAA